MVIYRRKQRYEIPDNELWHYSIALYKEPGVEAACLFLQNHYNLNVNLILALLWFAHSGRGMLTSKDFEAFISELEPWQEKITKIIRDIRQKIPKLEKWQTIHKEILQTELYTEKLQQSILFEKLCGYAKNRRSHQKARDAVANISNYYSINKLNVDEAGYMHTRHILAAAFEDFNEQDFPQMSMHLSY